MKTTTSIEEFATYLAEIGDLKDIFILRANSDVQIDHNNLKESRGFSQISSQQQDYMNACIIPEHMHALIGNFIQISYKLSDYDSKDFFVSCDGNLIYDSDPIWNQMYLKDLEVGLDLEKASRFANVVATGGLLSFSHFCGRNLLAILLILNSHFRNWTIVIPFMTVWIKELIHFYSNNASLNHPDENLTYFNNSRFKKVVMKFDHSILIEEIPIWAQLSITRKISLDCCSKIKDPSNNTGLKLYLSRDAYEKKNRLVPRIENYISVANSLYSNKFLIVFPEQLSLKTLAMIVYNSDYIVCSPGSAYMNAILFANRRARIIQMTPKINLTDSSQDIRKLIVQWFLPIMDQLEFWPSISTQEELDRQRDFSFVGSDPQQYNLEYNIT